MMRRVAIILVGCVVAGVGAFGQARPAAPASAQAARQAVRARHITTPKEAFGHDFGDDYFLANYQQLSAYWKTLAKESDRIVLNDMGETAEGRRQLMAVVTSPANHRRLARYKSIAKQLALARKPDGALLTDADARALAREGKTIVWIDGGLHATEVLGAQQLGEMVWQFVSRTDEETTRILDDCIILFVHANPDGNDLTADWYMRNPVPEQRSMTGLPRLYQKYIGHDNNRDFFGSTQKETENMNRALYREWFPQILYNHHQSGPAGTVLWSPPLRDPFNYNQDPLLVLGIQTIGLALHTRLAAEGKPGATMRSGGPYDGWWNGGLRNTAAFHNVIAILTEMIGNPTPQRIPLVMDRQLPSSDLTYPVPPTTETQLWHFRQSIDYSVATNRGVLDVASKMRENFLFNIYRMGKNSIERGTKDTWTPRPHRLISIANANGVPAPGTGGRGGSTPQKDAEVWAAMHRPEDRDPRAYVIPANQRDFLTAGKFVNALLETGIRVERAARALTVNGKTYPAGSFVVNTDQAFRPHVIDMFEPQDHPDNFAYPGAPPTRPYDNAGWTLAFQMGVTFDRLFDTVKDPALTEVTEWNVTPAPGTVRPGATGGYLLSHDVLDSFRALNALRETPVAMTTEAMVVNGVRYAAGSFWVDASATATLADVAAKTGISAAALAVKPEGLTPLRRPRIGLWDTYGGSMDAGWARWILEQFDFTFDRVFAPQLDAGNLNAKYDVLIFVDGAIPAPAAGAGRGGRAGGAGAGAAPGLPVPAEYAGQQGTVTAATTLPILKQFVEQGGTLIAVGGSATNVGRFLNLPMEDHLAENGAHLPDTKFYTPGSLLSARVDTSNPFAFGLRDHTDFFFDNSPVWKLGADAAAKGVKPIAWFDSKTPLRSGWSWGQAYLDGGVIAVDAKVGQGRVLLYGAEILQRAQPHGTFPLLFNGIWIR